MTAAVAVYGVWDDFMSVANVSRAICNELKRNHIRFTIMGHGQIIPTYVDAPWPISLNSRAPVGIYIGYPQPAPNYLKGHEIKILVSVCETNVIPAEWVQAASQMDYVFVPSRFCQQVFIDSGVKRPKVIVLPHGVHHTTALDVGMDRGVQLLHVTGAVSFPHRKSTPNLIKAWKNVEKDFPTAYLHLKMFREPRLMAFIDAVGIKNFVVNDTPSYTPNQMCSYLSGFDAIVQPSRGEGFGIVPLEARCLGIPTIITSVSGHSEHFAPGVDVLVETGPYKPLVTQGNADGFAPTVEAEHIEAALRTFLEDIDGHKARTRVWAERFSNAWKWRNTLKPLIGLVKPLARRRAKTIRLSESIGGGKL